MSKTHDIKWKRYEIIEALNDRISKVCVVDRDGEWVVKGKCCIISRHEDGTWDVWICDPNNLVEGLHSRSVTNRVSKLTKHAEEGSLFEGDGEAWLTSSIDFIIQDPALCKLLGIRRKRQLSIDQKMALIERLASRRRAKAA